MSQVYLPCTTTFYSNLTRLAFTSPRTTMSSSPRPLDMGSYEYLWRIKDQFLGARFADCYKGPEFYALGPAEQKRRVQMYNKRRVDEFWYLVRAYGRAIRWEVLKVLGYKPY